MDEYQIRELALQRRQLLLDRLTKAGISVHDLADLIWADLEPALEKKIEALANQALGEALKDLRLISFVQGRG